MSDEKKPKLKYLFVAEFVDGTKFHQNPEDTSLLDPEKRSAFYDLLEAVKNGKKIRFFSLIGQGNQISVDLGTGLFEINGLPVILESEKLPGLPEKFELIFYRQWTVSINVTYNKQSGKPIKAEEPEDNRHCEYFIGWQCNIKGKNYQQKIAVS